MMEEENLDQEELEILGKFLPTKINLPTQAPNQSGSYTPVIFRCMRKEPFSLSIGI